MADEKVIQNNEGQEEKAQIDIFDLARALWHKAWIMIAAATIVATAALCYAKFFITPMYSSTTGMYVIGRQNESYVTYSDTQFSLQILNDYKELIVSRPVLQAVIKECGLSIGTPTLKSRITISNATDTRVIYATVQDPNPKKAQEIADSLREQSKIQIKKVLAVEAVNTVQEADLPTGKSSPSLTKWTLVGGFAGGAIAAIILALIYIFDNTIKTPDDIERHLGWGTLAMLPMIDTEDTSTANKHHKKKSHLGIRGRLHQRLAGKK